MAQAHPLRVNLSGIELLEEQIALIDLPVDKGVVTWVR